MGNYVSCGCSSTSPRRSSTIKVILSTNGEELEIEGQVDAAELMLENPQHFVVELKSMQIEKRLSPLSADEQLEMGGVYILFPMSRAGSVVKPTDLAGLLVKANSEMRKSCGGSARVLPELVGLSPGEANDLPRLSLEGLDDESIIHLKKATNMRRSRRPSLETIKEETSFSLP